MTTTPPDPSPARPEIQAASVVSQRVRVHNAASAPRLGLAHWLVWLTAICISFSLQRTLAGTGQIQLVSLPNLLLMSLVTGTAWTGLMVTLYRALHGRVWPIEPGQWMLVILGVRLAVKLILSFSIGQLFSTTELTVVAVTACVTVLPLLSRRLDFSWKVVFGLLLSADLIHLGLLCAQPWMSLDISTIEVVLPYVIHAKRVALLVLPLGLTCWQARRGTKFGWLHWLGQTAWMVWFAV